MKMLVALLAALLGAGCQTVKPMRVVAAKPTQEELDEYIRQKTKALFEAVHTLQLNPAR